MDKLFSRNIDEKINECQLIAEAAYVEALLDGCTCVGFVIQLSDFGFEQYIELRQAIEAFVRHIESRIDARDFACFYIHPTLSEPDSSKSVRVVFDPRGRVIYSWRALRV